MNHPAKRPNVLLILNDDKCLILRLEMPHKMLHTFRVKNQITVRGLDRETEKRLKDLARRRRISLNKAAGILIRRGAGLREEDAGPEVVGESLDAFVGSWSRAQERTLLDSIRDMEQVDRDLWK